MSTSTVIFIVLNFIVIHNAQFAFPIPGIDGAQRIVSQQPVFDHECGDRAGAGRIEQRIVSNAQTTGDK